MTCNNTVALEALSVTRPATRTVTRPIPIGVVCTAQWQRFDLGHRQWLRGREYRIGRLRLHTTSTMSGLLFVAVGLVFLLFDGTAGLFTTGTDTTLTHDPKRHRRRRVAGP